MEVAGQPGEKKDGRRENTLTLPRLALEALRPQHCIETLLVKAVLNNDVVLASKEDLSAL